MEQNFLYHYTTFDNFINGLLKTDSIRLNSIHKVNDPIDSMTRYMESSLFIFSSQQDGEEYYKKLREFEGIVNQKWFDKCKLACFSVDSEDSNLKGYQLSNMWTFYTKIHTGICLKLNKNKTLDCFYKLLKYNHPYSKEVDYKSKIDSIIHKLEYLTDLDGIIENRDALFFQKLQVWDREQEFRLVCFSNNDYEYIPLIKNLEEIIFGQNVQDDSILMIKKMFPNTNISKMNYFKGDGVFEKVDIDDELWKIKNSIE